MKKCVILFLVFLTVLVFAALVENNQDEKDAPLAIDSQELTLVERN